MFALIFHVLKRVLSAALQLLAIVCKIVYNILAFFKIRLLALYLIVCGIAELIFHPFANGAQAWFWVGLALCGLITLTAWGVAFRRRTKKRNVTRAPKEEESAQEEEGRERAEALANAEQPSASYPRYFDAEGREGYIFAEYADRFELYRREGKEYILERVDEKQLEKRA